MNQRVPDEVIMDKSNALLLSVVKSFTFCGTTSRYLSQCYDVLFESADPPTCFIRLDRSHMVKIIKRIKELKTEDQRKRKLFERTFGYIMLCDDIVKVEIIMRKLFTLLLNKYEADDYVQTAKKDLKDISDLHIIESNELELDHHDEDDNRVIECEDLSRSKFFSWVGFIINDVKEKNVNHTLNNRSSFDANIQLADNIYYGPHLIKAFHELLATVPLWSNVMMKHFKSTNLTPTSSGCEVEFKNIKRLLFNNRRAIRLDSFVQTHMEYLNGQMKLALSEQKKLNLEEVEDGEESNHVPMFDEVHQEIWRDKNSDAIQAKKKLRVKRCKTSILSPAQPAVRMVPILRNGHKIIGRDKNPTFIMSSTCSVDAIFHGFAAIYLDDPIFRDKVGSDDGSFSKLLRTAIKQQDKKLTYEERNNLLLEAFANEVKGNAMLMQLDCDMAIATMYMGLCEHNQILCSLSEYKICKECDQRSDAATKPFVPTRLNDLQVEDLQDSITLKTTSRQKCSTCSSHLELEQVFSDIVAFDIEKTQLEVQYTDFEKISPNINLNEREYLLKAVVERKESNAHFVVHVRRNNNHWQSMDDMNVFEIGKPPKQLHVLLLLYCAVRSSAATTTTNVTHNSIPSEQPLIDTHEKPELRGTTLAIRPNDNGNLAQFKKLRKRHDARPTHTGRKCGICKEPGHTRATCSAGAMSDMKREQAFEINLQN